MSDFSFLSGQTKGWRAAAVYSLPPFMSAFLSYHARHGKRGFKQKIALMQLDLVTRHWGRGEDGIQKENAVTVATVATVTTADVCRFAFVSASHKRDFRFLRIFRRADSLSYVSGWGSLINVPTQLKVATEEHPARSCTTATDRRVPQRSGTPGCPVVNEGRRGTRTHLLGPSLTPPPPPSAL